VRLGEIGHRHCLRIQDLATEFRSAKDQGSGKNLVNKFWAQERKLTIFGVPELMLYSHYARARMRDYARKRTTTHVYARARA